MAMLRRTGAAIVLAGLMLAGAAGARELSGVDLTGTWHGTDGSTYEIKQTGTAVRWSAHSADNRSWAHDFTGSIKGNLIVGTWKDRATHQIRQTGQLTLRIVDADHLVYVKSSVGFGTRAWDRKAKQGCARVTQSVAQSRSRVSTGMRVDADTTFLVRWRVAHHGVPENGESPTLTNSSTVGAGTLLICAEAGAARALASHVTGSVEHKDVHELPRSDLKRTEVLTLVVKRGAWGAIGGMPSVALDIEVSESNDRDCPAGTRGRLTLIADELGNHEEVRLRLCGPSHTHTFRPGDDIDVVVTITKH